MNTLTEHDIELAIAPKSDQLNSVDLVGGPVVVTIQNATKGNAEQPVNINLAEFPRRPFKPSKSMLRAIVTAWGKKVDAWAGQRMELYRDPNVTYGGTKVGGIKISALTGIDKPFTIPLLEARKVTPHQVKPLAHDAPPVPVSVSDQQIEDTPDVDVLRELWKVATPAQQQRIVQRVEELNAFDAPELEYTDGDQ